MNEAEQFICYRNELNQLYGSNSRLIVLASRFTDGLLSCELNGIELWRYEIWWKKTKQLKNNKIKYSIDEIRVCQLNEDNVYTRLFEDRIQNYKRR
jgi:hypothetical protein